MSQATSAKHYQDRHFDMTYYEKWKEIRAYAGSSTLRYCPLELKPVASEENNSIVVQVNLKIEMQNRWSLMMIKWPLSDTISSNIPNKRSAKDFLDATW